MKNKIIFILAAPIFLTGCFPGFVPHSRDVGTNPYGGYIKVKLIDYKDCPSRLVPLYLITNDDTTQQGVSMKSINTSGELIAADSNCIYVLVEQSVSRKSINQVEFSPDSILSFPPENKLVFSELVTIPRGIIKSYKIRFATPKYVGLNLAGILVSLPWNVFAPLNALLILPFTSRSCKYNSKHFKYDDLYIYARYPQGIPDSCDIKKIY